ncbi:MAG: hypothetical protein NVSMB24_15280 [Mucilaginibacter sp.]
MKRIYLIVLLALSACAQSNQQKAEMLVKFYLDSTLNGSTNYKIIDFGKLDTIPILYINDPQWSKYYHDWIWEKDDARIDSVNNYKVYKTRKAKNFYQAELRRDSLKADSIRAKYNNLNYKPKIQDLTIMCKYRVKNKFGVFELNQTRFLIDSNMTKVKSYNSLVVN